MAEKAADSIPHRPLGKRESKYPRSGSEVSTSGAYSLSSPNCLSILSSRSCMGVLLGKGYALRAVAVLRAVVISATAQMTIAAATPVRTESLSPAIAQPRSTATTGFT